MIGKTLGHYEITDKLGQGGMGSVWLAQDSKLGRQVAIKTLPEEFAQDEERLARFEREAKLLASLNHPNIATIHGLEEHEGTRFLVLELVEGDTLADLLKRGAIPVEESLKLALQIAEALEAAHEKGVIHRDLKPANIKVTPEGKVKVLDFGLAKAFAGDGSDVNLSQSPTLSLAATQQGVILGTAAYMSPEQAKGLRADRRADIFSFGCVLFEMLTGRQAFQGSLATEIMASVITREPDYTTLQTDLNPRIKDLLHRCFEKEPKNRWQAVGDVRFETEQVLADPEGLLVEPSPAPLSQSFWPRAIPLVAATVVVTAVIAGIAVWNLRPTDPPEAQPIVRFSHILGSDQVFTRRGRPLVALSPDGTTLAYVANTRLYLRKLAEMESTPIQGAEDDPYNPFFSDDGEWVGYYSGVSDQLKKIPIDGGVAVPLAKVPAPYGASWTAENTILHVESGGVGRVSADGGPTELLVEARNGEQVHGPQLLPGGEWILFTTTTETGPTRWEEAQVVVESLATAERKQLVVGSDGRYLPTGHLVYAVKDALFAVPFDLREIEVTGGPNAVLDGVQRAISPSLTTGTANFVVSQTGVLAYVAAGVSSDRFTLALVDHNGNVEPLDAQPRPYIDPRVSPDGSTLVVCTFEPDGRDALWLYDLAGDSDIQRLTFEGSNWLPV